MASSHIIRLGKVKGENGVLVALKHNKRTLQNERGANSNIDVARTPLNYSLTGDSTPETIARLTKAKMIMAGVDKVRKDAVMAVEIVFSLPIDRHNQDTRPFFNDCYEWTKRTFDGEVLSFDFHADESAPHAHALLLPLVDGKMQGSSMVGGIGNLTRLRNLFYSEVARHYGLSRNESKRLSSMDKQSLEKMVLAKLQNDPAMQSKAWACFRDAIHNDPMPYAQLLSIEFNQKPKKVKSFIDIKRSKGKGTFVT
jgi:hypothetical protein